MLDRQRKRSLWLYDWVKQKRNERKTVKFHGGTYSIIWAKDRSIFWVPVQVIVEKLTSKRFSRLQILHKSKLMGGKLNISRHFF
jgi:hypothetical protein